jgi:glycosyltransferase involved in cell wall biosynthesis
VIEAGIDVAPFAKNEPDYASRTLGRITRNAPGKFHPLWSAALAQILACAPLVKARLVVDTDADLLKDARVEYVTGVKIGDDEAKVEALAPLSMAVIAEGDFEETFSVGMLECMAMGLPIVYLYQPALHEVLKGLPTCCDSIAGMVERVVALIDEPDELKMLGRMAREVAYEYSSIRMLMRWERLLGGLS